MKRSLIWILLAALLVPCALAETAGEPLYWHEFAGSDVCMLLPRGTSLENGDAFYSRDLGNVTLTVARAPEEYETAEDLAKDLSQRKGIDSEVVDAGGMEFAVLEDEEHLLYGCVSPEGTNYLFLFTAKNAQGMDDARTYAGTIARGDAVDQDMSWPVTLYKEGDGAGDAAGVVLCGPAVMGVTERRYTSTDTGEYTFAQYDFRVNGARWTLRGAAATGVDISFLYLNGEKAFPAEAGTQDVQYLFADGVYAARWFNLNGQYVLICRDSDAYGRDTFAMITEELMELTSDMMSDRELVAYYDSLAGCGDDRVSERAYVCVESLGVLGVGITAEWSDGDEMTTRWTMTAHLAEDGLLVYDDCVCEQVKYDENGNESSTVLYRNGEGFFGYDGEVLYWNGAQDDECRACEFVMSDQ